VLARPSQNRRSAVSDASRGTRLLQSAPGVARSRRRRGV